MNGKEYMATLRKADQQKREPQTCSNCGTTWVPAIWNFYGLCQPCFQKFDKQKMRGRLAPPLYPVAYTESAEEWIAQQKGTRAGK